MAARAHTPDVGHRDDPDDTEATAVAQQNVVADGEDELDVGRLDYGEEGGRAQR
jgi:hypothetical protein